MQKCYLCGTSSFNKRPGKVRDNEDLSILECQNCGLVFLSHADFPSGFYEQAKMHGQEPPTIEDWLRETLKDDERRFASLRAEITNSDVLDFGCGAGGFLIKAKATARNVMGIELEARLQQHFNVCGIKVFPKIEQLPPDQKFDVITAFHVIEHLQDPAATLSALATKCRSSGRILIEIPSSSDALLTVYENKPFSEFTYWSCHLYLFNAHNLAILAKMAGLRLDYVKHIQRYPLSNHLYWISRGKPGGHQKWDFLDSDNLDKAYEASLAAIGKTDTILACLSVIGA